MTNRLPKRWATADRGKGKGSEELLFCTDLGDNHIKV